MKENLIQIFSNSKLQLFIEINSRMYQLTIEEDISLKSLLLTTYLLTREEFSIYKYFQTILFGILKNRNSNQFDVILNEIIEDLFKENNYDFVYAEALLQNMIFDGYCFHSFNACFLPSIQEKGLVLHDKP